MRTISREVFVKTKTPQRLYADIPGKRDNDIVRTAWRQAEIQQDWIPKTMYNRKVEKYKKNLKLTNRQREILIGTLLGDSHLETQNEGRTYRLKVEHSFKQKEYVDWLYQEFREWVLSPPKIRERFVSLRTVSGVYPKYYFNTLSTGSLRFYAQQFYSEGKKVAPRLIHRWLTSLALAIWYMDDGSIKSNHHRTVFLNTHGFAICDLRALQKALLEKFNIKTQLRADRHQQQIYFSAETVDKFLRMIECYIIPSMRYKLPKVWVTSLPKR